MRHEPRFLTHQIELLLLEVRDRADRKVVDVSARDVPFVREQIFGRCLADGLHLIAMPVGIEDVEAELPLRAVDRARVADVEAARSPPLHHLIVLFFA